MSRIIVYISYMSNSCSSNENLCATYFSFILFSIRIREFIHCHWNECQSLKSFAVVLSLTFFEIVQIILKLFQLQFRFSFAFQHEKYRNKENYFLAREKFSIFFFFFRFWKMLQRNMNYQPISMAQVKCLNLSWTKLTFLFHFCRPIEFTVFSQVAHTFS